MSRKAKCWWCGRPANVRKDGTLGKHQIHTESRYSGAGNFLSRVDDDHFLVSPIPRRCYHTCIATGQPLKEEAR